MENAGIDLFEAMSTLSSVRRLRQDPIPDDVLRRILTAATWAPSGGNRQGWRFMVVKDPQTKRRLRDLYLPHWTAYESAHRPTLATLPEPERSRMTRNYDTARHLAERIHEAPVIVVVCVHLPDLAITDAKLDRPSVVGGGSIYPAVQNLLLACRAFGLGATLTTLLCMSEPKVRELLAIPGDWATAAYVPIGYPEGRGHGPLSRKPVEKVTFRDRWDTPLF
ncbi:MAG: nitroreductase family protein [Deltaproteobacteria bacterium]|nr:nitroreductase family protein [Deltaproteobacteria bacterium]